MLSSPTSKAASCVGQADSPLATSRRSWLVESRQGVMWLARRSVGEASSPREKPQKTHGLPQFDSTDEASVCLLQVVLDLLAQDAFDDGLDLGQADPLWALAC